MAGRASRIYDYLYRRGAPWEGGPRAELVDLVESGRITPAAPGARVLDLGCGSGASAMYLASRGFDVVGIDLSPVAIDKARKAASEAGVSAELVVGDLMETPSVSDGPFDLLLDGGTVDDFSPARRPAIVERIDALSRPGSLLVVWCFYAWVRDLPVMSFSGPSRRGAPSIEPDELRDLYAGRWTIELLSGGVEDGFGCFLLTRD
jgi:SAM-dependent methyltransferase